jgi:hypothetical protein
MPEDLISLILLYQKSIKLRNIEKRWEAITPADEPTAGQPLPKTNPIPRNRPESAKAHRTPHAVWQSRKLCLLNLD